MVAISARLSSNSSITNRRDQIGFRIEAVHDLSRVKETPSQLSPQDLACKGTTGSYLYAHRAFINRTETHENHLLTAPFTDMIDKNTHEIRQEEDVQYTSLQEVADELPDHSPRFVLLSYPLTTVSADISPK